GARGTAGNPGPERLEPSSLGPSVGYLMGQPGPALGRGVHKRLKEPSLTGPRTGQDGTFGGLPLTNAEVATWDNADSATVSGLELNAQFELSFLPSPFDGLSAGVNLTFVDSEAEGLPSRDDKVPLLNQSDRVA